MNDARKKVLAAVVAAIILPIAIVEAIAAWRLPARVPTASDWASASARVRREWQPGDLLIFAPSWLDQIGRSHLGDLTSVEMLGRADDDRYARIWVVGLRAARSAETAHATEQSRDVFGQLTVARYEQPAATVKLDFVAAFNEARVTSIKRDVEKPCLADGETRRCSGTVIERRTTEVEYEPRRAILVPIDADAITRLEYDVELGKQLVVHLGLHDYYARKVADGPIDLRVLIDGVERTNIHHGNRDGWRRIDIDTSTLAPGKHVVRFEVSAKAAAWRLAAIAAEARL